VPPGAWIDWGGQGTPLHFGHANGFPPRTYGPFLRTFLPSYRVASLESRPLWPGADPKRLPDWSPLVGDLQVALEAHRFRGALGMGHSLGAITSLWAATEDPGLFRALVLVDPSFFAGSLSFAWKWLQRLRHVDRTPIVAGALRRRDRWGTRGEARAAWRDKPLFRTFRDECFEAYLDTGLAEVPEGGLRLRYPKAWEAAIFRTTPADPWDWVRRSPVPTLLVRGQHSNALTRGAVRKFDRLIPRGQSIEVPGTGHMLPLEQPGAVSDVILRWLQDAKIT
jgi:pimeloyl-ACP methyl ester carboxylesterase